MRKGGGKGNANLHVFRANLVEEPLLNGRGGGLGKLNVAEDDEDDDSDEDDRDDAADNTGNNGLKEKEEAKEKENRGVGEGERRTRRYGRFASAANGHRSDLLLGGNQKRECTEMELKSQKRRNTKILCPGDRVVQVNSFS